MIGRRGMMAAGLALVCSRAAAQGTRPRRLAVMMDLPENAASRERVAAFREALKVLGWGEGRNVSFEVRWGAVSLESARPLAANLIASRPDLVLAAGSGAVSALIETGASIPIVFTTVADPVAQGFVSSMARPGGRITGFSTYEFGLSAKSLEFMAEIVPGLRQVFVVVEPQTAAGIGQSDAIRRAAEGARIEFRSVDVRREDSIRGAFADASGTSAAGVIVTGSPRTGALRDWLIGLAAQTRVPTIYPFGHFVDAGGLAAYGPSLVEAFAKAASYVDRILRGANAGDLPIQAPDRYVLSINLGTARSQGIPISSALLARADEVIE